MRNKVGIIIVCVIGLALVLFGWYSPRLMPKFTIKHSPFRYQRWQALAHLEPSYRDWWCDELVPLRSTNEIIAVIRIGNDHERRVMFAYLQGIASSKEDINISKVCMDYQNDQDKDLSENARYILKYDNLAIYNKATGQYELRKQ